MLTLPACLLLAATAPAADLDLTRAVVVAPPNLPGPAAEAVRMLTEEVAARSFARWDRADTPPAAGPAVLVGLSDAAPAKADGFRITTSSSLVRVEGHDARGVLFGVGRLLREPRIGRDRVTLPASLFVSSAPTILLRGHQLGYRPKTNSYDGGTAAMWEQYVRDLVVFGCNAVELIPPRSDDDADSPLFPAPPPDVGYSPTYGTPWSLPPMLTADQLAALRKYPTPTVANALERLGAPFNCTDGRVRCLFPELGVSLGYAVTATVRSAEPPAPDWVARLKPYWDHVAAAPGPKLLVAQELDRPCGGAFYGEVNSTIHQTLGCVGLITDGAVRDLEETRRLGFQFLAAEVTVSHGHAHLAGWGEPVEVFGLRVSPGDLIHADRHGAVVIPAAVAERVADACRAVDDAERPILELCRSPGFSTAQLAELVAGIV